MKCPICKAEQYCSCSACIDKLPNGERSQLSGIIKTDKSIIIEVYKCAYCGHEASEDAWLEDEIDQLKVHSKEAI